MHKNVSFYLRNTVEVKMNFYLKLLWRSWDYIKELDGKVFSSSCEGYFTLSPAVRGYGLAL